LAYDHDSGPGSDAFISHYTIDSSGTYYARVISEWSTSGSYEVRVDVARGIQLESDAGYANDSIAGANTLKLWSVGARRTGTIAGTLMASEGEVDQDYFKLGTVQDGESILLSLRVPESSTLRPIIEIRRDDGTPTGEVVKIAPNPTETVARANITEPGTYYAVVVAFRGQGPRGEYLLDAVIVPTGELEFADLALTAVSAPATAMSGETIPVTWTVGNFGTGSTYIDRWYDRVVLSTDDRYGDPNDIELAVVRHDGVLDYGEQDTTVTNVQLPVGLSGDYWILVESDEDNRVFEYIFESNNIRKSASQVSIDLTPYADLAASNVSAPAEVLARDPITITWVVTNEGAGTTGDGRPEPEGTVDQWTDRIVFSRNPVYGDQDDQLVAEVLHDGSLAPGASYMGSWTGEVPGYFSGEYYVFVATDFGNDVYEHDDVHPNVARGNQPIMVRQWIIEPGTITEDTVWNGLLKVLGRVTVASGVTLTIEHTEVLERRKAGGQWELGHLRQAGRAGHFHVLSR